MKCNNCGKDLLPGAEFCGNCGAKLVAVPSQPIQAPVTQPVTEAQPAMQPANTELPVQPPVAPPVASPTPAMLPANPVAPAPQAAQQTAYAVQKQESTGLSVASMVLGILALLSSLLWFIAGPLAILAIIFGFVGKGKGGKGMALAGIITGGLSIIISVLFLVWALNNVDTINSESTKSSATSLLIGIL